MRIDQIGRSGRLVGLCLLGGGLVLAGGCASGTVSGEGGYRPDEKAALALFTMSSSKAQGEFSDPQRVAGLRSDALALLLELSTSTDPQTRANVIEALQLSPERLESAARRGLRDENQGVRAVSAMVVGRARLTSLTEDVRRLIHDESPYVWTSAAYALAACGETDERVLNQMVSLMLSSESTRIRSHIAVLLGDLGEASAIGPLTDAIAHVPERAPEQQVRLMELQIAEAMYKLGQHEHIEVVRAALYPSQVTGLEATALAAQILGEIMDAASTGSLIGLTATEGQAMPAEVRLAAAGSLAQLGHPQGAFIAEEFKTNDDPALRAQSAYVYGRTGQIQNLARLEASLSDPSTHVQVAAAAGILRIAGRMGVHASGG